ncbi:22K [Ovine mastadenovirus A]|uniref:22K n=1 Tax=Ovine mastadenovirus A TaxID=114424 RepID=UPI00001D9689|nr:22K [Ovine mastadenovirus A]
MPRSKKLAAATRPSSLNLTNPKLKKPKLPQTPPPTPEEEDTMESFVEDIEEEWDDVDSLETHGSGLEDVDLEDGETLDSPPSENIPPAPKTTKASKQRRWDQTSVTGKQAFDSDNAKYKSWRKYKHIIINSLLTSDHDVAFTRRYLLYRHKVNIPKNVIHYYNSQCREGAEEAWKNLNPVIQYVNRASRNPRAES